MGESTAGPTRASVGDIPRVDAEPVERMPEERPPATSQAWFWPLVSLVGVLVVAAVNWLANALPSNDTTMFDVLDRHRVPFRPADWTFFLWVPVHAGLVVYTAFALLNRNHTHTRIGTVGPLLLVANALWITWIVLWHWERIVGSLITAVALALVLVLIYLVVRPRAGLREHHSIFQRLLVQAPFSIALAWTTVLGVLNLEVWMRDGGWDGGVFGLRGWTVIFLLLGVILAAGFAMFGKDAAFPVVFLLVYLGIAQEQWTHDKLISLVAVLMVIFAAGIAFVGSMLAFDARNRPGFDQPQGRRFWRRNNPDSPPSVPTV